MNQAVRIFTLLLLWLGGFTPALSGDYQHPQVKRMIDSGKAPDGVVFELISWDEKTWTWAAPMLKDLRRQLQSRFADIDVVVVSHGGEQFQLTREREQEQPEAIAELASLSEEGVSVHVCGTHSSWQDVDESAYLDFVDVSPSGPAQINDYIKLGYEHILLSKPD